MTDMMPQFEAGDCVRVLQTDLMVAEGLANLRGFVVYSACLGCQVLVQLDTLGRRWIAASSLQRFEPNYGGGVSP